MSTNGDTLMLTVRETAALLHISEKTVYKTIEQGTLPHVRFGRVIRIPRFGLERWIAEQAGVPDMASEGVELSSTAPNQRGGE